MYRVNEIFFSLQGEGYHTGRAAVFVRMAGCNLRCAFCDTDFSQAHPMTAQQIADAVFAYSTHPRTLIVLTGGEPSLQADDELIEALHRYGQQIAIETNGTRPLPRGIDWVTVSPKADSAEESSTNVVVNNADEVKVVLTEATEKLLPYWRSTIRAQHYFLQPCSCKNTDAAVAYVKAHPEWQLSLQTHKYIHIQ